MAGGIEDPQEWTIDPFHCAICRRDMGNAHNLVIHSKCKPHRLQCVKRFVAIERALLVLSPNAWSS